MGSEGEKIDRDDRGYRFGEFTLDIGRAALLKRGKAVPLRPQSFDVLRYLVDHSGRLVEKHELIEAIWGDTVVTDDSITHCLIDIRKALGDSRRSMIRTVPRRGYIFEIPVERIHDSAQPEVSSARPARKAQFALLAIIVIGAAYLSLPMSERQREQIAPVPPAPVAPNSIAVLPFTDMSEAQQFQYFGDGLAEEILNSLARNAGLRVTARTSSFSYRTGDISIQRIAQALRVANVLEGSVRVVGDRASVAVQLVGGETGEHLWSGVFDRPLDDTIAVQREIAQAVSHVLSTEILGGVQRSSDIPDNREAYDLYLQARFLFHRRSPGDLASAGELYRRALELEPEFARAWSGLAGVYFIEYSGQPAGNEHLLAELKYAAERAVEADPNHAEGWYRLSGYYAFVGDTHASKRHLQRALEEQPDDPLMLSIRAGREAREGNLELAAEYQRRALERDPLSAINRGNLAFYLYAAGKYDEAISVSRMAAVLHPESSFMTEILQGFALVKLGEYEQALDVIDSWPPGPDRDAVEAMARLALGQKWRAGPALKRLGDDRTLKGYQRMAELRAFCLEIDESFIMLEKVNHELSQYDDSRVLAGTLYNNFAWSPFLEPVRGDPRWPHWLTQFRALTIEVVPAATGSNTGDPAVAMRGSDLSIVR